MLIDPYHESWLDRLSPLADAIPGAESLYLLVDGVFVPGLHRLIHATLPRTQAPTLLFEKIPGCTDESRDVSPFIFPYQPSNSRLRALLARCSGWPMISAIETRECHSELTERLAAWCVVGVDEQRFNFRFPDTRRLPAIFEVLTAKQRAEFAGPASRWLYIARNGSWGELAVSRTASAIADQPKLADQQFAKLVSDSEVDEVITVLQYRGCHMSGLHSKSYVTLSLALRVANKVSLSTTLKLSWCESCLRDGLSHDEIEARSQFAQWMNLASWTGLTTPAF